jgi:uncharacterized heparinase superfamily protein
MTLQGSWRSIAWRADVLARRIISWLSQAPLLLHEADPRFYRRFLRQLSRQVRFLRKTLRASRDGLARLQAIIALTYAALCMAGQVRALKGTTRQMSDALERQILPDGGHISRNPGALIELLLDLLPLRQAYAARNVPPPQALLNAIDRMMPMLRFFRHGDGNFALFNGMGPTPPDLLATALAYDDARGMPVANAPHSGYQRLQAEGAIVLVDTGRPPPIAVSHEAHAGCLSFELSAKQQRIVVNCGLPAANRDSMAPGRARDACAFDRHHQRRLVVPVRRHAVAAPVDRHADRLRTDRRAGVASGLRSGVVAARLAQRLCGRVRHHS